MQKIGTMLHGLKEALKVSVQLVFYMLLHQARAHGNPEPFSEFRQASATHTYDGAAFSNSLPQELSESGHLTDR
jgi:hypothetical protein